MYKLTLIVLRLHIIIAITSARAAPCTSRTAASQSTERILCKLESDNTPLVASLFI